MVLRRWSAFPWSAQSLTRCANSKAFGFSNDPKGDKAMELSRRTFVVGSTAGLIALSTRRAAADANSTIVLALMGANNRGSQLATGFAKFKGVEFAYVCDPDERAIAKGIAAATSGGGRRPQGLKDFRKA